MTNENLILQIAAARLKIDRGGITSWEIKAIPHAFAYAVEINGQVVRVTDEDVHRLARNSLG